jgi:EmrB/QacA subfamily drug resistance transporter
MNKNLLLIITSLATFGAALLSMAVSVALPSIGVEFSLESHLLGWVTNSFVLATAAVMIPIGRIADIYGRKKIFTLGLWIFIVSSIMCVFSNSSAFLISFRAFQGIGAAMIWGPAVAILTSFFPPEERGKVIGINTTAVYCGLSLGPFWGGYFTEILGWRSVFYVDAAIMIVIAVLALWKMRGDWAESRTGKLDVWGSLTLLAMLFLILYGLSSLPSISGIVFIILGLAVTPLYYRIETRNSSPVLDVNLFRKNRVFLFTLLGILVLYSATFAPIFLLSLFLQYNQGYSPSIAGAILVVQFLIMAVMAPFAGRISDKVEPLRVSMVGMGISFLALVYFVFLNDSSPLWFTLVGLVILGFGFGMFASPAANAVMSSVDKKYFGVASGSQAAMRHIGQVVSMAIVMILFAVYIGDVQITPEYYPEFLASLKTSFIIFAILCFGGIFVLLAGGRLRQSKLDKTVPGNPLK